MRIKVGLDPCFCWIGFRGRDYFNAVARQPSWTPGARRGASKPLCVVDPSIIPDIRPVPKNVMTSS